MKSFRLQLKATHDWLAILCGKRAGEKQTLADRLLWRLAKSEGNLEDDVQVFQSLQLLSKTLKQNQKLCAKIFVWSMVTSVSGIVGFYLLKVALEADRSKLGATLFVAAAFVNAVGGRGYLFMRTFYEGDVLSTRTVESLVKRIAQKLKVVHRESLRQYINDNGTPWATVKSISDSIGNDLIVVVKDPFIWLFNLVALWWVLSWEYAAALLIGSALMIRLAKPAILKNQEISKEGEKLSSSLQTTLDPWSQMPRLISDRGISESMEQKLGELSEQEVELYQKNSRRRTWLVAGPRTLWTFVLLVLLLIYAVYVQHRTAIDVILLTSYFTAGIMAFVSSIDFTLRLADIRGGLLKLGKLLTLPDRPNGEIALRGFEGFVLRDLRIHYGDKTLFPEGLDLEIGSGQPGKPHWVAVVGPSGCGKSSMMEMLSRHLENIKGSSTGWSGECLIRSMGQLHSIAQTRLEDYPWNVVPVPQETEVLMAESVARNIGLAVEKLPAEQRQLIIRQLSEKMLLPTDSLEQLCQEQSGGQRKRTQIAAALAVRPAHPVAIMLDEAMSQLDQETAVFVLKAIEECATPYGDTVISIAHSEYAIHKDSYVIVLGPNGMGIVEQGWKAELASNPNSAYNQHFKD